MRLLIIRLFILMNLLFPALAAGEEVVIEWGTNYIFPPTNVGSTSSNVATILTIIHDTVSRPLTRLYGPFEIFNNPIPSKTGVRNCLEFEHYQGNAVSCVYTIRFVPVAAGNFEDHPFISLDDGTTSLIYPYWVSGTGVATLSGPPTVEFYNTNLDNYFITADSNEAAAIDNGSAGPGWIRTGYSFKSGGSTSVCRFYGSQSPGPNSHFYTVDPGECASLKQLQANTPATQKRWNYESLDFVSTPSTNGTCPTNTTPVYRAYNNGYSRGVDSNHRITSSQTAIQEVVARGWSNEGVVMCAPN